jgi:Bacterial PH domain
MPAVSETSGPSEPSAPTLPHTWRPLGVRLAVWFFGGMLAVVCVAGWVAVGADVRARVTIYQQATVVLLALAALAVAGGLVRCKVTATAAGLDVVNGYRLHHYEWAEVLAIHMPQGAPFPTLDLADGTSRPTFGIQASDGDRARQAVRELRVLLARTAAESLQRPDPPAD